jgi:hypothetical protein
MSFVLPDRLTVVANNAGLHDVTLSYRLGEALHTCLYRARWKPVGQPDQFVSCTSGAVPGDAIEAGLGGVELRWLARHDHDDARRDGAVWRVVRVVAPQPAAPGKAACTWAVSAASAPAASHKEVRARRFGGARRRRSRWSRRCRRTGRPRSGRCRRRRRSPWHRWHGRHRWRRGRWRARRRRRKRRRIVLRGYRGRRRPLHHRPLRSKRRARAHNVQRAGSHGLDHAARLARLPLRDRAARADRRRAGHHRRRGGSRNHGARRRPGRARALQCVGDRPRAP